MFACVCCNLFVELQQSCHSLTESCTEYSNKPEHISNTFCRSVLTLFDILWLFYSFINIKESISGLHAMLCTLAPLVFLSLNKGIDVVGY